MADTPKRLYLASTDKKLAGVCGGVGEYFGVDSTLIRIAWILITIMTGIIPGLIAYIVAAVIMPSPPEKEENPKDQE